MQLHLLRCSFETFHNATFINEISLHCTMKWIVHVILFHTKRHKPTLNFAFVFTFQLHHKNIERI